MLKDIKIVFIAYFADYITQASDLSKLFRDEGATVFTTSKKKNVILRAYEIAKTLITEKDNFDVVVIQSHSYLNFLYTPFALIISKFLNKKFIVMYLGGAAVKFFPKYKSIIKPVFKLADEIVVGSGYLENEFRKIGIKSNIIPAVINLNNWRFKKRNVFKPKILWLRALFPEYNPGMAIRVIKNLEGLSVDAVLTFVGNDRLRKEMEELSIQLNVEEKVKIMGHIDPSKLQNIYDSHDIFINTTHVDNQPRSIIEAMACGLPVISTNVGGCPYVIDHEKTGFLVEDNDDVNMTNYVLKIINDEVISKEMTEKAKNELSIYNWKSVKEKWEKII